MSLIKIDRKHIKEIKKYLTLSDKEFKKARKKLEKAKTMADLVERYNTLLNLREESSTIMRLLIKTLEFSEKQNSSNE